MLKILENAHQARSRLQNKRRWFHCRLLAAGQKVSQKYRRAQIRKNQRKEYKNLKRLIPVIKQQDSVSKMTVVEEAIKYIDELHAALFQRFSNGALPKHVLPEALPIIQLLQTGQLPLPGAASLQQRQQQLQQRHQQQIVTQTINTGLQQQQQDTSYHSNS